MIITNTSEIPGKKITEILGVVRGNTVRARNIGRDIFAGLRGIVGGEINEYTELMTESREEAMRRMEADALQLNADAIVNIRFMTSPVMQSAAEIMVYGTAVKLEDDV